MAKLLTKFDASQQVSDHVDLVHVALDHFHRDGFNAEGVLRNPHVQASALRVAREELGKAIAIIEQKKWR